MAKETLLWYVAMATMTYFVMAEPPSIQQTSNSFNLVEAGDSLVLECTADIRQVTITWLKDELPVDTSLPEFEQSGNSLNIINIQRGDTQEGNYKCNVSNSAGEWTVLQYPIVVKVMYINDDFVFKPRNTSFYELDDGNPNTRLAWTNCAPPVALPRVTVEFINGSSGLPVNISDPRIETPTPFSIQGFFYHQIQIHNATIYDVGNWICRAKHQIKTIDAVFGIEMYRAPPAPQNVKVKKFFIGKFLLGWDFVRKDIQYYHLFIKNVATGVEKSIKIIEYPSPAFFKTEYTVDKIEHKQQYEVELRATDVKNQVGEWSSLLVIDVPEEFPPYMTKKLLFLQYVGEGSNLEIECPAEGVPAPTFEWLANNVTLEQNAKYRFNGNKLTIVNMIRGEDMKIKCRAINKVGYEDSNEMNIKVEWLNEKFDEPPQSRLFYPSSTELNIRFRPPRGFKAPELRYMIDDKNISSTTHPHYSFTFFIDLSQRLSVSFTIRNPNILAEGKYKAIASNGAGTRVAEFQYALAGAPGKITYFKAATVTQRVILEWEPPKSSAKIAELGDVFEHRFDIRRYIFEYKESSSQSGVTFENFGYVVDQNYIRRAYVLENIPVGVDYVARIKCVDQGLQESPWSDWVDFKIEQNIRPFIKEGPQLSPQFAAGENATLTCIVESNDQVSIAWFKNEVQVTSNEYLQVLPNNSLAFYNIRNEMHDGKYYCQATNAYGSTKSLVSNVKVNYLLAEYEFTTSEVYVYNVDGFRNAIIRCLPPQSSPSVDVLWTTGLSPLITESDFLYAKSGYVVDGREYYALFVINAVQNDGQSYGCVALNPQLSPFYRITLTTVRLMGKPVWTSDIIIEFPTKDTLNVTWEKEREDIASWEVTVRNGDTIISQTETTKTSIEFTGTFVNLQYTYEVVMIDVAGQRSEPRAAVTSSGRPKLVKDLPLNYELKAEGENASLVCEFSGNPFPNITWYKDGSPLDISATNVNHFSITNDGQTLRMTNLSRNIHRGKYMCNATNQDGSANTREIDYRISYFDYDFAVADVSKEFYDIDGERFIRFQCSPPMSSPFFLRDGNNMYWTKDGVNISKSNTNFKMNTVTASGLLIDELEFNATANSVGTYRCVYVSRGERREHAMNLTLFDGPLRPRGFMMKERHWSFVVLKWEHPAEAIDRYFIQFNGTGSGYTFVNVSSNKMEIKIRQLIQSTSYKFTIYSVKDNKMSMGTSLVVMTSQQPSIGLPDKPVNVKVESIGLTEVTILWEHPVNLANNHPDELQYKIRVCDGNVNSCSWKLIGYVTQYKVTGLSEQTGYMFEVHAVSELGGDGEIYRNFFTTLTGGAPPNINGFRVLQKSWNFIQVGWDEVIDKQSLQEIVLSRQAGSQVEEFRINRDKSEFTYTSLSESTSYQLLIKGVNELLSGPVSSITESTEKLAEAGRVTGVKTTYPAGYETERIMIEWKTPTDIGNNNPIDMAYRIILCTNVNPRLCQLHTLYFNETSFTGTELQADTEYDLTIFTMRADGSNGQSYERQFKTKKENKKPSKPKSIKMQKYPTKFSEITLSWDHPDVLAGNDVTNMKYRVEHCEKVGSSERNCKQYEVTDTSIKLTELKEGQSYETRISAITFRGELGDTEIITFTTDTATTTTTTTTTISSTSTTTTTGKTTTTSTTTARTFPTPKPLEEDAGLSTGVKVGIAIAVIILIIIIIGSIVVYMRSRRTKNKFNRYSNKNVVQVEMNGRH